MHATDTIFAQASGVGRAGVAVIRISGPQTTAAVQVLTKQPLPAARQAVRRQVYDPATGALIDDGLLLWFPHPNSYTGEDVAELQLHGGLAIVQAVYQALNGQADCRLAEPGEFTRRAFLNGKMDLTQAEAVADLIAAETALQREQALRQYDGTLRRLYESWAEQLLRMVALAEAYLDFPDEDLPAVQASEMQNNCFTLIREIQQHLQHAKTGERLRSGIQLAIIGAPNAGKSTLINKLSQRDVAIVSPTPGTTRDVLEVQLDLHGYPITLADTAGLRSTDDTIEQMGIARATAWATEADLKLALFDLSKPLDSITQKLVDANTLIIGTKLGQASAQDIAVFKKRFHGKPYILIDTPDNVGITELLNLLHHQLKQIFERPREQPLLTRARHREALQEALDTLIRGQTAALPELQAEDWRMALRALGRLTGQVHLEELLDIVFREFCIGK